MAESCECPGEAGANTCEIKDPQRESICPSCGARGKRVDLVTLKALLAVPLTEIQHADYFFCRTADCATVYFSAAGEQRFPESALRERVYQRHPGDDDVFVCYCFRHTVGSIRRERESPGQSNVVAAIADGIKGGMCACEIRNPQGSCCLGNVRALLAS